MLINAIAHGGCTDTVRDSALEVDSGRKIPCCTEESNPCQYCAGLRRFNNWPIPPLLLLMMTTAVASVHGDDVVAEDYEEEDGENEQYLHDDGAVAEEDEDEDEEYSRDDDVVAEEEVEEED